MGVQGQVAERQGLEPLVGEFLQGDQVALRLAHPLLRLQHQELPVQPVADERLARRRLGLSDLVGVVDGDVVRASGVDVELLAQVLGRHGGALDVPAGKSPPPRAVPFHLPVRVGGAELPEREIGLVALAAHLYPDALLQPLRFQAGQPPVVGEPGGVEVDAVVGAIGEAPLLQPPDQGDLLGDVLRGPRQVGGNFHAQQAEVGQEALGEFGRHLPGGAGGLAGGALQLVLARIGVGGEVAHVGDVDDVVHLVTQPPESLLQNVGKNIAAEVADVRRGVHGRTAGVDSHPARRERPEGLLAASEGIEQL